MYSVKRWVNDFWSEVRKCDNKSCNCWISVLLCIHILKIKPIWGLLIKLVLPNYTLFFSLNITYTCGIKSHSDASVFSWLYFDCTAFCIQVNEAGSKLVKLFERAKRVENSEELVVTKAKKMGKELFVELDPESRKQKLDTFVSVTAYLNCFEWFLQVSKCATPL